MALNLQAIIQQIAISGDKQIVDSFKAISKAGEDAFNKLDTASKKSNFSELTKNMSGVQATVVAFEQAFTAAAAGVIGAVGSIAATGGVLVAVGVSIAGGISALAKSSADALTELKDTAIQVGTTTDKYQGLANAALQAGTDQQKLKQGLSVLNQEIDKSIQSGEMSSGVFKDFGIILNNAGGSAAKAGKQVEGAFGEFRNLRGQGVDPIDALKQFADVIATIPDPANRAQAVIEAFGRRVGPGLVPLLELGSKRIGELGAEIDKTGGAFSEFQINVGKEATQAFDRFSTASKNAKTAVGNVFDPLQTQILNIFTEAIAKNRIEMVLVAGAIATKVTPAFLDFANLLTGNLDRVKSDKIRELGTAFIQVGTAVKQIWEGVLKPSFEGLMLIFDGIAKAINAAFGTQITGQTVAVAAALLWVFNIFGMIAGVVSAVAGGIAALVALFGGIPVLIAAIVAGLIALSIWLSTKIDWKKAGDEASAVWQFIQTEFNSLVSKLTSLWNGFVNSWKQFGIDISNAAKDAWDFVFSYLTGGLDKLTAVWTTFKTTALGIWGAIKDAVSGAMTAAGQATAASPMPAMASGGPVYGRGTSTSDDILAWLSNGEYVQPARAVARYGKAMMESIRNLTFDPYHLRGFAEGGLVSPVPISVASSGAIPQASRIINLRIDGIAFDGLKAGEDTADKLEKFAISRQLRSAGRKPNWFGT